LAYQRSFVEFEFGQGAALSNLLIAIAMIFAGFYLWRTRKEAA
jgi:multiple sugar transport system permease protein